VIEIERKDIMDVTFIVPKEEMESGMFFLSGADSA
jgi:hypothetical protein